MMIVPLLVLTLMACESATPSGSSSPLAYPTLTPPPLSGEAAYAAAQATLAAGQSEMMALSNQATLVSLNMQQAANAAAQATLEYHQRQLMELSIRGTDVSQNMAWAAATQQFIAAQTQLVWDATASAQSQAATATYSAYILNVTQTAQVQAILHVQATQAAQANATQTAYSLTATPWTALQADIVRTREEFERRAWWDEFIVTPLKVILFTLVVVLLIVGGVRAYQRLMPVLELRLRTISRPNDSSSLLVDGVMVDAAPHHPQLLTDGTPPIEVVGPSDPSVVNWIAEAEQKLRAAGRRQL
jgi:hypothetical protein